MFFGGKKAQTLAVSNFCFGILASEYYARVSETVKSNLWSANYALGVWYMSVICLTEIAKEAKILLNKGFVFATLMYFFNISQ